ncbi:MAG: hypothetical protein IJN64_11045 [Lachnospiraceae bacterium]|nr:hypothetical protein [Lachnospiraceae bacterium]
MKKGYKIGLFFTLLMIVLLIVLIIWKRYTWREQLPDRLLEENSEIATEIPDSADKASVSSQNIRTTCDTICIYEDIDQKDGTVVISEERIPGKYIDMTRADFERALYDDSKQLSLTDKERGFRSQHLELFSREKVKIVRIYDTTVEEVGYYIMAVEGKICVYKQDKETIFFETDLMLYDLPEVVQREVLKGKYIDSELKVYHFLESYSS